MNDGVIRYGDRFRLRWVSRKRGAQPLYLVSAEKGGREYYPRVGGVDGAVLLMFAAPHGQGQDRTGQPVSRRATVQLQTTEDVVGPANTIGAWKSDHFLYYHPPGKPEQDWQIEIDSTGSREDKVRAGDFVVFYSRESSELRMTQDQKEPEYLTLDQNTRGSWQIELVPGAAS